MIDAQSVDNSTAGVTVYRHKLLRSSDLRASDGVMVLESTGAATTRMTEHKFFRIAPSPVPAWLLWRESLRGSYLSNAALKFKAEHPEWGYAQIRSASENLMAAESRTLDRCLADRGRHTLRDSTGERP